MRLVTPVQHRHRHRLAEHGRVKFCHQVGRWVLVLPQTCGMPVAHQAGLPQEVQELAPFIYHCRLHEHATDGQADRSNDGM